jgi:hypothetical protein
MEAPDIQVIADGVYVIKMKTVMEMIRIHSQCEKRNDR